MGKWLRAVLLLGVAAVVLVGAGVAWLLRDPRPHFAERRSELVAIEEAPPERSGGYVSQAVRLRAASGLSTVVLVRTPADTTGGPLARPERERRPLFLVMGGHRTGERAALLVEDTRGAVVAAMDYPYHGPEDVSGLAVLRYLPEIRSALLDTPPAVRLVLDYLLSRPDVDPERVDLLGVSLGAFLAPAPAALDERVSRLWLVHGAARPYEVLEHGLARHVPFALPRALVAAAANVVFAGPLLAPEVWVPRVSPRPVVMINARNDRQLPPDAVHALHASAREPKEVVWLEGEHVRPDRPEVIDAIMDVVLERVVGEGLAHPRGR